MINGQIGVIGASGFIGNRLTERLVLEKGMKVKAIVRGIASCTRLARFDLPVEFADVLNKDSLTKAFAGCSVVFHAAVGDTDTIVKGIENTLTAAAAAGVKRIVYLSSAVVHGYNPAPGTNDGSPLIENQPSDYARDKVRAELIIRELRKRLPVEVVVLRPYIVYGPGSTYNTIAIARGLVNRSISLIDHGEAAFNGVYIDNLVDAMLLAAEVPRAANQDFIVQDDFQISWKDYISALCQILGVPENEIPDLPMESAVLLVKQANRKAGLKEAAVKLILTKELRTFLLAMPLMKQLVAINRPALRSILNRLRRQTGGNSPDKAPSIDEEWLALFSCQTHLPIEKAKSVLGYRPAVDFQEAMRRTGEYLHFACLVPADIRESVRFE